MTAHGDPVTALVGGRNGSAETDDRTVSAAFGRQILDERAVSLRDPPVLTIVSGHPFLAEREGAGAARIGRIIALDRPRD